MTNWMKARLPASLRLLKWAGIILGVFSLGAQLGALSVMVVQGQQLQEVGLDAAYLTPIENYEWFFTSYMISAYCALAFCGVMALVPLWLMFRPFFIDLRQDLIYARQIIRGKDERTGDAG